MKKKMNNVNESLIKTIIDFNELYTQYQLQWESSLRHKDFSIREAKTMLAIERNGVTNAKNLSLILGTGKGQMSRMLDRMQGIGLIRKEVLKGDRRFSVVYLTTKGREETLKLKKAFKECISASLATLKKVDLERLELSLFGVSELLPHPGLPLNPPHKEGDLIEDL